MHGRHSARSQRVSRVASYDGFGLLRVSGNCTDCTDQPTR